MGNSLNKHISSNIVVKEKTDNAIILERYYASKNKSISASVEVLFFLDEDIDNLRAIADSIYEKKKYQRQKKSLFDTLKLRTSYIKKLKCVKL